MSYKSILRIFGLVFIILILYPIHLYPDTIYFKNGGRLEGIIKNEDENSVELEIAFGTIKSGKDQIEKIEKSNTEETDVIQKKWEREKQKAKESSLRYEQQQALQPKTIAFSKEQSGIVVNAVINKNIQVSLVLDTGASLVLLTKGIGQQLGISLDDKKEIVQLQLADGRKIDAKYIILESVGVQHVEAQNVAAAVLVEDVPDAGFKDGLLGMSFLNKFNFKIDQQKQQLILEKFNPPT